jgi:cyclopropane fatty-acyl-phospholipid synthase-like methyltransferase
LTEVWRLYETHAATFDRERGRQLIEAQYLRELLSRLPARPGQVLDLGCGMGEPIAAFLIEAGCAVTGVDAAPAMIARCRSRFPGMTWVVQDMRTLALGRRFDAVLAWDSFFHLRQEEQRSMFPIFRDHLSPGGVLLFTSGPRAGEAIGEFGGEPLYHASLDPAEYRQLLERHGLEVIRHQADDPDCGGHTVWLAKASA